MSHSRLMYVCECLNVCMQSENDFRFADPEQLVAATIAACAVD